MNTRRDDDPTHRPANENWQPGSYEIRVKGHLDAHWSAWFDGMTVIHEDDGTTVLRGAVADQAALHGLLQKVRDLALTLISVTPLQSD